VVHGADGIDELTTAGYTKISECRGGTVNTFYLHPADVGLSKAPTAALRGGDARANAGIIESILNGEGGAPRDVVLLNAGAALFVAGAAPSVQEGIAKASQALDRGEAKRTLEKLVAMSATAGVAAGGPA
jgi:anthranilate phosphoribosyltransferase